MSPVTLGLPADVVAALHARSGARRWQVSPERLAKALAASCAHHFAGEAPPTQAALTRYLDGLYLDDLVLACACRDGHEGAWEHFVREVQPKVEASAQAIAGAHGRELARTLLADLYGTTERDGVRRSLLDYFHGRSRLTTWLRTVVAQRHVDRLRDARRSTVLPETEGGPAPDRDRGGPWQPPATRPTGEAQREAALVIDRSRLLPLFERELARAVSALAATDRLRLAYYYVHRLTLARIARLMREHESSASRKLDRTRRELKTAVERVLRNTYRLSEADLRQCYEEAGRHGRIELPTLFDAGGLGAALAPAEDSSKAP
jgi:RNA polymerase sigma-70 factor (ECF subfamily)